VIFAKGALGPNVLEETGAQGFEGGLVFLGDLEGLRGGD
jgi:hypothetical protein